MLDSIGQKPALAILRDSAPLKLLLAPVFARSAEEQKRFYEVFDIYAEQLKRPQYEPVPLTFWEKLRAFFAQKWVRWLLALAALLLAAFLVWKLYLQKKDIFPEPRFATNVVAPGDTVRCSNQTDFSGLDSAEYQFSWRLERQFLDKDSAAVELEGGHGQTWDFIAPPAEFGVRRDIVLSVEFKDGRPAIGKNSGREIFGSTTSNELRVACQNPPALPRLKLPGQKLEPHQTATFALAEKPKKGHHYRWQIIGDTLAYAPTLQHRFDREGTFEVQFLVSDSTQPGVCYADTFFRITVGDEQVVLPLKPLQYDQVLPRPRRLEAYRADIAALQYDQVLPRLAVGWATWLLLVLLAAGAGWFWWRWFRREQAPAAQNLPLQQGRVGLPTGGDKPPYYIPFREPKNIIRTAKAQFRLADAMRLRQQTEDLVLDLPTTLRATMEGGGYPNFKFRHRTRPTEYLLLVDEQLPGHHLARLFRHLAETLRGQDVALDLVWHDADLRRFWGPGLPKSVRFDGLRRFFPQHRLVLLGAGLGLLDEFSGPKPRLRSGLEAELNRWPQRLLLTSQPPVAWGWREAVLYRYFGLFPADLRGMLDAATFVENGLDTSDMPLDFGAWRSEQLEKRDPDANPEYLKWRSLADHEPYLRPYGEALRRWFLALAVHPSPTWEITLAIARALGIAPTHDRLLALSRIPALREGRLHPGLRREMLQNLAPADETSARQAVLTELREISHLTEGSHVAEETDLYIVVQDFLLEPTDATKGEALALRLDAGMVSRNMEMELDVFVEKTLAQPDDSAAPLLREKMQGQPAKIRLWLEAIKPAPSEEIPPPPKPFFAPDFWRAVACTVALLLAALTFFHPASPVFDWPEKRENFVPGRDSLRDWAFLHETWTADSAVLYNNLGVNRASDTLGTPLARLAEADSFFQKAIAYREKGKADSLPPATGAYFLARQNQIRARYNRCALRLRDGGQDSLAQPYYVAQDFEKIEDRCGDAFPTEKFDARHGAGLAYFYGEQPGPARFIYQNLKKQGYFDTLALRPNLETLLRGIAANPELPTRPPVVPPSPRKSGLEMVRVSGGTFQMGSTEPNIGCEGCSENEMPQHAVTLSAFEIGKYEVTQADWRAIMGINPSDFFGCDECPVESVSWDDIQDFLKRLNAKYPGKNYRLPTEAEWEYAARGGQKSKGYEYAGSNSIGEVAWHYGNSGRKTHPVGGKTANELGVFDMSGNVWEWCSDWYGDYASGSQTNPLGASSGDYRVLRGGSWYPDATLCRSAFRFWNHPSSRYGSDGFRLARH